MIITNAIILHDDEVFRRGALYIQNDLITEIAPDSSGNIAGASEKMDKLTQGLPPVKYSQKDNCADEEILDAAGCYVIPGLIDLHFHGALGQDVCDGTPEAYEIISAFEASRGITAICPATLTLPVDTLRHVLSLGASFKNQMQHAEKKTRAQHADLVGFNMEGPFINRVKKGAQNEDYILPCSAETARSFYEASNGLVKFIGLAPEENPDFTAYIESVSGTMKVSLAHSNADYDTAMRAIKAGACHAVHLYNAMPEFLHRDPGIVGAVADSPNVTAELICDGIHVHPSVVRSTFHMMGADRLILISDSLRCTGMPDGIYQLGGQNVKKEGARCTLLDGGNLAGSVSSLMDCMVNAVKQMGLSLETAVQCASTNPAKALGIYDSYGSLTPGKRANLVLLDQNDLSLRAVIKDGIQIV